MKKIKVRLGVTTVLVSVAAISVLNANKNIGAITPKDSIKEVISLAEMENTMKIFNEIKEDENLDKEIAKEAFNYEVISEPIELVIPIDGIKEDIEDAEVIGNKHVEEKNLHTPSRGGSLKVNKPAQENLDDNLNKYVLDIIKTYSLEKGNYPYLLNNDFKNYNGVTEDLYYKGELLLKANPNGNKASHCTGITFEVFFKAMKERNKILGIGEDDFNGMSKDQLMDFVLNWYVAQGAKSESNLSVAIVKYGLGTKITNLEDLQPGDFIDLSRENNTGHAVIFQNWIREGNRIIGLRHWSSQGSTNGISYKEEYFNVKDKSGKKYGNVIIDQLHMARISPVGEYKKY